MFYNGYLIDNIDMLYRKKLSTNYDYENEYI